MPDLLPGIWSLSPIGGLIGTLILAYWLLTTGRLWTRSAHESELKRAIERAEDWKETAKTTQAVNAVLLKQNSQLIEANRITNHFYKTYLGPIENTLPRGGIADAVDEAETAS